MLFFTIHGRISLLVVSSVDKNLIKDFVQAWNVADVFLLHGLCGFVENPREVSFRLHGSYVGVWTEDDVFQLSLRKRN